MTDILILSASILLFYIGNKAFNIALNFRKKTDPPTDFSDIENPQMLVVSFALFTVGCLALYSIL